MARASHPIRVTSRSPILVHSASLLTGNFGVHEAKVSAAERHIRLVLAHLLALCSSCCIVLHHIVVGSLDKASLMLCPILKV